MFDVITIGSATRDVFLVSGEFQVIRSNKFKTGLAECVSLGSKIEVDGISITTGGGGTNTAATFASLGLNTAAVARIGDDVTGRSILSELEELGIHTELVKTVKNGMTGYSTLLTTSDGERSVLVHRGVSKEFTSSDLPANALKTKWLYITSLGGNLDALMSIVKKAKRNKVHIAWNPGSQELKAGMRKLEAILKEVHVLILNKEEARMLTKTQKEAKELCNILSEYVQIAVVTDGLAGTTVHDGEQILHGRPTGAKAVSRTGAGDAFGSGFVAAIILGHSTEVAIQTGTLNAESVIQSFGAKQGILKKIPKQTELAKIKVRKV